MKTFRNLVCLSLIAAVACSAVADEAEKKGKGKKGARKKPAPTQRFVGKMELTDEQKTQVAAIDAQFAEKFAAGQKAMSEILTDEQRKARQAAQKAAKEAGKKAGEARKEIDAAVKLSDEQKAKQKTVQADQRKLQGEIIAALKKVLTAEQQEKLPKSRPAKGEKPKKKKKEAA